VENIGLCNSGTFATISRHKDMQQDWEIVSNILTPQ